MKSQYGMVFYPKNLFYAPDRDSVEALVSNLQVAGFMGASFAVSTKVQNGGITGYLIGDQFLKLLVFLGCSPHIEVTPPEQISDWGNFCYLEIRQFQTPHYYKGLIRPKCSCPQCKSRVSNVLPKMEQWSSGSQPIICPKCQQASLVEDLNWRHGAGFGQFFMVINSVYPNEAVPSEKLINLLASASNEVWDYFYVQPK